jgi:beta-lactamase superfamily II metal-dependent hydrolase
MAVTPESLCVHVLNVGDGDGIVIQFPTVGGNRKFAVVDCCSSAKTLDYLNKLGAHELEFVCATHPHFDHIAGIPKLLTAYKGRIREYWDSGFRHTSVTAENIVDLIEADPEIRFMRVTSGMERVINGVNVTVLAPSISLRNRYDTYGVNINNASVLLKLEHKMPDASSPSIIVLGGDAQYDSWAKVLEEFPKYVKTENPQQRIKVTESSNPLNCNVLKVSHHGSKHGTALECIETLDPEYAIVSCSGTSTYGFPHEIALLSIKESTDRVFFTDFSKPEKPRSGTTVVISRGIGTPEIVSLGDDRTASPNPP